MTCLSHTKSSIRASPNYNDADGECLQRRVQGALEEEGGVKPGRAAALGPVLSTCDPGP